MDADLPGRELSNDPDDNPCFGCGPRNPVGLRLRFFDDGETVRAPLVLDDRYCGWPGDVIEGVLYTAMDDTIYWAACTRFGRHAKGDGHRVAEFVDGVRTDTPFTVEARVVTKGEGWEQQWATFEGACRQDDRLCARLVQRLRPRTDAEHRELLERPRLPRSIRDEALAVLGGP